MGKSLGMLQRIPTIEIESIQHHMQLSANMIETHDKLSRVPGLGESYPIRVLKDSIPVHSQAVWSYQALQGPSAKSIQVRSEIETLRDSCSTLLLLLLLLLL